MAKVGNVTIEEVDNGLWLRYHFNDSETPDNDRIVKLSFDDIASLTPGLTSNLLSDFT